MSSSDRTGDPQLALHHSRLHNGLSVRGFADGLCHAYVILCCNAATNENDRQNGVDNLKANANRMTDRHPRKRMELKIAVAAVIAVIIIVALAWWRFSF
ncbi:hypothetical protein [Oryzicola mucosus]|uniref:Transmembrane protein n=1 Tax=Oryzicola mucosus TaxID=2767425 RepID=A0A8J6U048_9HYPH|nr:hypothetical protein [Oryzicola mucosus]MBD0415091.1 hypothetical protein [Oryzicola mucosus]